ncbi:MAG: FtsW/RodA/SpoVE family cell cycle protein [Balneolales bacterium]
MYLYSAKYNSANIIDPEESSDNNVASDRILMVCVVMLMMAGLLAVYSSIAFFAENQFTTAGNLVGGHIVKMLISFLVLVIFSKIDYHIVVRFSRLAVLLSWLFLIIVTLYGIEIFGARRSLNVGGFSFQPSSLAIIALLIHVVVLVIKKQEYIKDFKRSFIPILLWIGVTCGLIGLEDFSSAAILFVLCLIVMFVGRVNMAHIGALMLVGVIGAGLLVMQTDQRQARISSYIDQVVHIQSDDFILGQGYQAQQAHIAVAQGQFFGVGIGKSSQRDFLPAPYNDFIFSIITEEYGLLGATFILFLFTLILFRGIAFIARRAVDRTGALLAVACTLMIAMFGFVNAAVATGLFPVTGLPMPMISYGGTNMLFSGIMIGILLNISKQRRASDE